MAQTDEPVISVANLCKCYGDVKAVDGVSFEVGRGEVFGMLGPNGAGKTTTIEILEGLREPDSGAASVLGMDVTKHASVDQAAHRRPAPERGSCSRASPSPSSWTSSAPSSLTMCPPSS